MWTGTLRVEEGGRPRQTSATFKAGTLCCTDEETGPKRWSHFPAGDQVSVGSCCFLHKNSSRSLCSEGRGRAGLPNCPC